MIPLVFILPKLPLLFSQELELLVGHHWILFWHHYKGFQYFQNSIILVAKSEAYLLSALKIMCLSLQDILSVFSCSLYLPVQVYSDLFLLRVTRACRICRFVFDHLEEILLICSYCFCYMLPLLLKMHVCETFKLFLFFSFMFFFMSFSLDFLLTCLLVS